MSLSAVQGERTQWAAGGGTAKDAGEPRHDTSLPPLPPSWVFSWLESPGVPAAAEVSQQMCPGFSGPTD